MFVFVRSTDVCSRPAGSGSGRSGQFSSDRDRQFWMWTQKWFFFSFLFLSFFFFYVRAQIVSARDVTLQTCGSNVCSVETENRDMLHLQYDRFMKQTVEELWMMLMIWRHQVWAASHTLHLLYTRVCCHSAASHTHLLTQGRWRPMLEQHMQKSRMKVCTLFQQHKKNY